VKDDAGKLAKWEQQRGSVAAERKAARLLLDECLGCDTLRDAFKARETVVTDLNDKGWGPMDSVLVKAKVAEADAEKALEECRRGGPQ